MWGTKDQFLQTARELADTRDASAPGEWEKVVIMGKQLAPEDALFSQSYSGTGTSAVDLNLEGGQNLIDFDLHGEPSVSLTQDGGVDMDLGAAGRDGDVSDMTGSLGALDFMLDDLHVAVIWHLAMTCRGPQPHARCRSPFCRLRRGPYATF